MKFDLVSDLHIDVWDEEHQEDWLRHQNSDVLVVAGDISDWVDQTCEYVDRVLCVAYNTVLIVDGNHEHQPQFPRLKQSITNWEKCIAQTDAHYLGQAPVNVDGVNFFGKCGWWSFDFGEPNISEHTSMEALINGTSWGKDTYLAQKTQGIEDAIWMKEQMSELQKQDKPIVVVSHSLPHPSCISWNVYPQNNAFVGLYGNSYYDWVFEKDRKNLMKYWVFGHNHDCKDIPYRDARLISNPRGRPEDWNREEYKPLTLEV